MDEMNLLRDRVEAQPAPRPEVVASALDRLHNATREPERAARFPIRLLGSRWRLAAAGSPAAPRRWSRQVPRLAAVVVAATVVAVAVTTTAISRGSGEDRPLTLAAMGVLGPEWHEGDPEIVVFFCKDDSPDLLCGGGGFAADDGGSGPPPDPILGGKAATPQDKAAVERTLGVMPQVEAISFVSKQEAYADLSRKDPKLSKITDVEDMTESFTLKMKTGTDWNTVIETAKTLPGVSNVFNRKCLTENALEIAQGNRTLCAPGGLED